MSLLDVVARLKLDEGFNGYVYLDSRGFATLGYGFCVDTRCGTPLPDAVATAWLSQLASNAQSTASTYPWWSSLNDARQNVVTCLLYNLGKPRFDEFVQMQAALAAGNWSEAADQLKASAWYTQVGVRGPLYVQIMASGAWQSG